MPLSLACPCGQKLKVRDELAGKKVKCPKCAKLLVAPLPDPKEEEPLELDEAIEEEEKPSAPPKKPAPTAAKKPASPWQADKKKPPPPKLHQEEEDDEDDEEEEDEDDDGKPAPFWVVPGTLSSEVLALAEEGIWFASLKADALKKTQKLLQQGVDPADAMGKGAGCIPWESVISIYCNQKLRGFTIHYSHADESVFKEVKPAGLEERDRMLAEMANFLKPDWVMRTVKLTPLSATILPIACIAFDLIVTGILAFVSTLVEDIEVRNRWGGGRAIVGVGGLVNLMSDLGPLWISVIGVGLAIPLTIWLMLRVLNPPIEVTIARAPHQPADDED